MGDVPSIPTNEKRQRMHAAVLDAVAQGRQSLSPDAAKHIAAEIACLTAERDEAIARADLLTGTLRMCVNCGKTRPSSEPKDGLPACSHPDYPGMAACTWDATPQEAWEHWRKIAYDERTRAETAEAQAPLVWKPIETAPRDRRIVFAVAVYGSDWAPTPGQFLYWDVWAADASEDWEEEQEIGWRMDDADLWAECPPDRRAGRRHCPSRDGGGTGEAAD